MQRKDFGCVEKVWLMLGIAFQDSLKNSTIGGIFKRMLEKVVGLPDKERSKDFKYSKSRENGHPGSYQC